MFFFLGGEEEAAGASPYLDGVLDSVVFELDATVADSYGGSGTTWANLTASPADGSAQSAYDFTNNGFTFTGTAGDAGAYWLADGTNKFDLSSGANTSFINSLHKTTGGTDWYAVIALLTPPNDAVNDGFFATQNSGAATGLRCYQSGNENFWLYQYGDTTASVVSNGSPIPAATDSLLMISHSASLNQSRYWVNSATAVEQAHTFNASVNDASGVLALFTLLTTGVNDLSNTARAYHFSMGNEYLDNTKAAAIITALETRHARDYTP